MLLSDFNKGFISPNGMFLCKHFNIVLVVKSGEIYFFFTKVQMVNEMEVYGLCGFLWKHPFRDESVMKFRQLHEIAFFLICHLLIYLKNTR